MFNSADLHLSLIIIAILFLLGRPDQPCASGIEYLRLGGASSSLSTLRNYFTTLSYSGGGSVQENTFQMDQAEARL